MRWCAARWRPARLSPRSGRGEARAATSTSPRCSPGAARKWRLSAAKYSASDPGRDFDGLDEAIACANDSDFGLTHPFIRATSTCPQGLPGDPFRRDLYQPRELRSMQGFHAGWRKSGIGGADGKHGLYEFTPTHVVYIQRH